MQRLILLIVAAIIPGLALAQAVPVPEPTTMALLAGGVAAAGLYKRLTRKKNK